MRLETSRQASAMRNGVEATPGSYMLESRDKKFSEGSALIPVPRPAGDPDPELLESAIAWFNRLGDPSAVANKVSHDGGEDLPF